MKKIIFSFAILASAMAFSQVSISTPSSPENKWTFGGGIGLGFGSNSYFSVGVSPRVGYKLMPDLEVGALASITFQSSDYYNSSLIGVGPFANYYFARSFYASAQMQHYFINYKDKIYNYKAHDNETALYLGGGYMQRIGNNSYAQIGLMYNVLWKENSSIFSTGLMPSIGFVVGL